MKEKSINIFNSVIYWSIIIFPFSMSIAPAFSNSFMAFIFIAFFLKKILKKEPFFAKTAIDFPFFLWVFISIISTVHSQYFASNIRGVLKLVQYAFMYLILVEEIRDRLHVKRIVLALVMGASLASFDALWQIFFGKDFIRGHSPVINIGLKRATAAFPNANILGIYLSPIAPLAFGLARYYLKAKKRIFMYLSVILISIALVLTFSRPAALAFYLSLLFLGLVKKDRLLVFILIAFLFIAPFIAPQSIKNWAKEVNYNPIIFMCNQDRISIYRNTLNMIEHHPFLGVGLNSFSKKYSQYKLPEPAGAGTGDTIYAHNNFLHMAGEIGLFGLAVFLWLLFRLFKAGRNIYKNFSDPFFKTVSLSIIAAIAAFLINGLTETSMYYSRISMIFWFLIGFCLALEKFTHVNRKKD